MAIKNLETIARKDAKKFPSGVPIYLGTSMADAGITVLRSYLEQAYTEGNHIARSLMERHNTPGMGIALGIEYAGMFALSRMLPRKLRPIPLGIASFVHTMGAIHQLETMSGVVPNKLMVVPVYIGHNVIIATEKLSQYGQNLYELGSKLF